MVAADSPEDLAGRIRGLTLDRGRLDDPAVAGLQFAVRASWMSLLDELWRADRQTAVAATAPSPVRVG